MITGAQIRAARAFLKWTTEDLAARSGVASRTIKRFEAENGIPQGRTSTLSDLQSALESGGIEFFGLPNEGPGVRLWNR